MDIKQAAIDDKTILIELDGTLNAASASAVKQAVQQAVSDGRRKIVLDMREVPFIDSSGLTALVSSMKLVNAEEGTLKLAGLQSQAKLLFNLTMFDQIFDIFDTADAALKSQAS
jgi:anti-anti-sigma factor